MRLQRWPEEMESIYRNQFWTMQNSCRNGWILSYTSQEMYTYKPSRNGFEPPRVGENQSWYEPVRNELSKSIFSPRDKAPMYNRDMPQNGPSTYEVGVSSHNFQFNTVKEVSNPTFKPRNNSIEGNGRPFIGPNRQTGNADCTNQISVSTQPLPNLKKIFSL